MLGIRQRHQGLNFHDAESSCSLCSGSLESVQQKGVFKGPTEIDSLLEDTAAILNTALDSVAPLKTSQRTEEGKRTNTTLI